MRKPPPPVPGRSRGETGYLVLCPAGLLEFLLDRLKPQSRSKIKSLLAHRRVLVDGTAVTQFNHSLRPGQRVSIGREGSGGKAPGRGVKIVFEDRFLIVIEKPAGLLSIATAVEKHDTAYHLLSRHVKKAAARNKIFIVHRLDREASGLMLFAKDRETKEALQRHWRAVVRERTYTALVEGRVDKDEGTVSGWVRENAALTMYAAAEGPGAQRAVTRYRVRKRTGHYSLLEVELETGRKNQIRLHLRELGHSIVGDKKYGAKTDPLHRLGLHAQKLVFTHPVTKEDLHFSTPLPASFERLLKGN